MSRNTFVTEQPVLLDGYQAVMSPSKFGYSLAAIVDEEMINKLEEDRVDTLKWAESKPVSYTHLPSPRDATLSRMPSSA